MKWKPIEDAPEGEHILVYMPHGERGNGGIEAVTLFKGFYDGDEWSYWTHGGPNAGSDFELIMHQQ